jgi:hypothetical protein
MSASPTRYTHSPHPGPDGGGGTHASNVPPPAGPGRWVSGLAGRLAGRIHNRTRWALPPLRLRLSSPQLAPAGDREYEVQVQLICVIYYLPTGPIYRVRLR